MTKQIYNTRDRSLDELKGILLAKQGYGRKNIEESIAKCRIKLDEAIERKQRNELEIAYLEKFITRKEKNAKAK